MSEKTFTTEIDLPIHRVAELFMDKNNLNAWQKELVRYQHLSGTPGEAGSKTKLEYKSVTIIETITAVHLPSGMSGEYEHQRNGKTIMSHKTDYHFTALNDHKTKYELKISDEKFYGFLPKLMSGMMAGAVKKHYNRWLAQFKVFAEKER
jgi:hypothetical protein